MNKTQKRELVKQRRFHHQVSKKCKDICHVVMEPAVIEDGYPKPITSPNMDVIESLTMKELEYVINNVIYNTRINRKWECERPEVQVALNNELTARRLLLAKSNSI